MKDYMSSVSRSFFIQVFAKLCQEENLYARRSINETKFIWKKCQINLANSFPDILLISSSNSFENTLYPCLEDLIKDKNENVREEIAKNLVNIAQCLGSKHKILIINVFCTAIMDESYNVSNVAIKTIVPFINLFPKKDSVEILTDSQVNFLLNFFFIF
jgi:hypothetical protein